MYELDKGPQPLMSAKRTIQKCQALLDKEIVIQTRMIDSPSRLLKLDPDEELTQEDMRDLIETKKAMAERAKLKGEMSKLNKATADIAQFEILIKIYDEIDSLKKARAGI